MLMSILGRKSWDVRVYLYGAFVNGMGIAVAFFFVVWEFFSVDC